MSASNDASLAFHFRRLYSPPKNAPPARGVVAAGLRSPSSDRRRGLPLLLDIDPGPCRGSERLGGPRQRSRGSKGSLRSVMYREQLSPTSVLAAPSRRGRCGLHPNCVRKLIGFSRIRSPRRLVPVPPCRVAGQCVADSSIADTFSLAVVEASRSSIRRELHRTAVWLIWTLPDPSCGWWSSAAHRPIGQSRNRPASRS